MCDDNLLDILTTGGDLNDVTSTSIDGLTPLNENKNPYTYYEISTDNSKNNKNNKNNNE